MAVDSKQTTSPQTTLSSTSSTSQQEWFELEQQSNDAELLKAKKWTTHRRLVDSSLHVGDVHTGTEEETEYSKANPDSVDIVTTPQEEDNAETVVFQDVHMQAMQEIQPTTEQAQLQSATEELSQSDSILEPLTALESIVPEESKSEDPVFEEVVDETTTQAVQTEEKRDGGTTGSRDTAPQLSQTVETTPLTSPTADAPAQTPVTASVMPLAESDSSHLISIKATSSDGSSSTADFTISVNDVKEDILPVAVDDTHSQGTILLGSKDTISNSSSLADWGTSNTDGSIAIDINGVTGTISATNSKGDASVGFDSGSNDSGLGVVGGSNEIDLGETITMQFDTSLSNATIGLDSLYGRYDEEGGSDASVAWTAYADGVEVAGGNVVQDYNDMDGDGQVSTNTITVDVPFDTITFSPEAESGKACNFTINYLEADAETINTIDEDSVATLDVLGNDFEGDGGNLHITEIDGQDVTNAGIASITDDNGNILGNAQVTDGGKITFSPSAYLQEMNDGDQKDIDLSYTVSNERGDTDSAIATLQVTGNDEINPEDHIVSHWDFETNAYDSATAGEVADDGSLQGDAVLTDHGTLLLDGDGDHVDIANSADINVGTHSQRSITFTFKADEDGGEGKQVIYEEGASIRGLNIYLENGELSVGGYNTPESESDWQGTWINSETNVQDGQWHQVTLVLDGGEKGTDTDGTITGYLDGESFGSGEASQLWSHTGDINIGSSMGTLIDSNGDGVGEVTSNAAFKGEIGDGKIYDIALDETQVQDIFSNTTFPEISSTTEDDSTASAGEEGELIYVSESAGYRNVVGIYETDDNGNPTSATVVIDDQNGMESGTHLADLTPENHEFFIIANGASEIDAQSSISFDNSGDQPVLLIDGEPASHPVYYTEPTFNPDGKDHFQFEPDGEGGTTIYIEDLPDLGDADFQDVVLHTDFAMEDRVVEEATDLSDALPSISLSTLFNTPESSPSTTEEEETKGNSDDQATTQLSDETNDPQPEHETAEENLTDSREEVQSATTTPDTSKPESNEQSTDDEFSLSTDEISIELASETEEKNDGQETQEEDTSLEKYYANGDASEQQEKSELDDYSATADTADAEDMHAVEDMNVAEDLDSTPEEENVDQVEDAGLSDCDAIQEELPQESDPVDNNLG